MSIIEDEHDSLSWFYLIIFHLFGFQKLRCACMLTFRKSGRGKSDLVHFKARPWIGSKGLCFDKTDIKTREHWVITTKHTHFPQTGLNLKSCVLSISLQWGSGKVKIRSNKGQFGAILGHNLTFPDPHCRPGQIFVVQNGVYMCPAYSTTCFKFNQHLRVVF